MIPTMAAFLRAHPVDMLALSAGEDRHTRYWRVTLGFEDRMLCLVGTLGASRAVNDGSTSVSDALLYLAGTSGLPDGDVAGMPFERWVEEAEVDPAWDDLPALYAAAVHSRAALAYLLGEALARQVVEIEHVYESDEVNVA